MATFTHTTTAAQDDAVKLEADEYNRELALAHPQWEPVGPMTLVRRRFEDFLNGLVQKHATVERETKVSLLDRMTAEDRAIADALFDKYRSS